MKQLLLLAEVVLMYVINCYAQRRASDFYKFFDCKASSTYRTGENSKDFDATRALQPGSGYWCSAGHHSDEEEVTWTGFLSSSARLQGLKIRWAYSPEEVQVSVSSDGADFHIALPYRRTPSLDVSFDEDLYFEHPETARAVVITMRKAMHEYFGINEVTLIGSGDPLTMLISGITSPSGDTCLQVELGKTNYEGAEIILEPCTSALAFGDGRELWRQNDNQQLVSATSHPPKCLTLQDGNAENGGKIVLSDCMRALEDSDGRSNWSFEANSQLRLLKSGSFCLSQKDLHGTTAQLGNVIKNGGATSSSSSNSDSSHGAEKAIDHDIETFWASGGFKDAAEHLVNYDIDLGKEIKCIRIRIDWEYPAFSYEIRTSVDKTSYLKEDENVANAANTTLETLGGHKARYVRIAMLRPHPVYGKADDSYLYGIREIQILANNMQSVVEDCRKAANSDDARDKYFIEYVSEFDSTLAKKVNSMEQDILSRIHSINELNEELQELFPKMETCLNEKQNYQDQIDKAAAAVATIAGGLATQKNAEETSNVVMEPFIEGETAEKPAEDCFSIKRQNPAAISGFYWLEPRCAPERIRAYCDMKSGTMLYLWNGTPPRKPGSSISQQIQGIDDVKLHCAEVGLEPFILKQKSQLVGLQNAVQLMGFKSHAEGVIPLGFDYGCLHSKCRGKIQDFMEGSTDQTMLINSLSVKPLPKNLQTVNSAGLHSDGKLISFFDLQLANIVAIPCSTNTMEGESELPHVDVQCSDTARDNDIFSGIINTNIVVDCPPGCEEESSLPIFGSNGVYSDSSSVCGAAIHAGLISSGGLVNVALESPKPSYEGSVANGMTSNSLNSQISLKLVDLVGKEMKEIPNKFYRQEEPRSLRLGLLPHICPIELFEEKPAAFFESKILQFSEGSAPDKENSGGKVEIDSSDPALTNIVEKTMRIVDQIHGIDPILIVTTEQDSASTVGEARKRLKPSEKRQEEQSAKAIELYSTTEDVATRLYELSSESYDVLEKITNKLLDQEEARNEEAGFRSFVLNYTSMPFSEYFVVHDSSGSKKGPSDWGYSEAPVGGRKNSIGQSSEIAGARQAEGTFAMLKRHRFFDFIFTVKFYARGSGTIGVAFQMRDFKNMYLLEFNQRQGFKRLLRIKNDDVVVLGTIEDGGYLEEKWFHVYIETARGNIRICSAIEGKRVEENFNLWDETFLTGTVGLMVSGVKNGAFFDDMSIKAKPCTKIGPVAAPLPPQCSNFEDSYFESFRDVYEIINPGEASGGSGIWRYERDVGGRKKVLAQLNAIQWSGERGTMAILSGHRTCQNGFLSVDIFPECTGARVGLIFHYLSPKDYYVVEVGLNQLRIRLFNNDIPVVIAEASAELALNLWHTLQLSFEASSVSVKLYTPLKKIQELTSNKITKIKDGRVGLFSCNCGGVAFDKFRISPSQLDASRHVTTFFNLVPENREPWIPCNVKSYQERNETCRKILQNAPRFRQNSCIEDFCSECCHFHTSLLHLKDFNKCKSGCQ